MAFFKALPPCSSVWKPAPQRTIGRTPAKDVKAHVRRNAEAICEAVRRPTMRFVRVKSAEQGQLMQSIQPVMQSIEPAIC